MSPRLRVAVRRFGPFESAMRKQFTDFARVTQTQAQLVIEPMDLNPLHESLFEQRGLANGDWDLAFLSTDWIAEAQAQCLVENLVPHQQRSPIVDFPHAWSPSLTGLQTFAGGYWGMPYHDGPQCLIYRKDLLAAAGLAVPRTWDEFHAAARALHAPAEGRYGTVLALFPDGHNSFYDFCIQAWTRGGEPFGPDAQPRFLIPEVRAGVDFLRALAADTQAVVPGLRDLDSVKAGLLFSEGKVALMTNWFGFAAYCETSAESQVAGKVDIAPIPAANGGASVSLNVYWLLCMAAGSRNKALAWEFMRHVASAPMDKLTTSEGAIGVRLSTWNDAEVNARIPYYHKLTSLHHHARQMPLHPRLAELSHVIDDLMTAAVTTDVATSDLLKIAQRNADQITRVASPEQARRS